MAIDLGDIPTGTPPTAGEKLQIRSAIGVGTTDPVTFLAQTLTGQSLTGTQATSLVDLATTWNTSGTPTAIKLNVVETGINSNAASLLMDLQVGSATKFKVDKNGVVHFGQTSSRAVLFDANGGIGINRADSSLTAPVVFLGNNSTPRITIISGGTIGFSGSASDASGGNATPVTSLSQDAAGILAQRNGVLKQVFRVYNTNLGGAPEWGGFDWQTTANTLRIGTDKSGTGASQPIDFVTGGVVRMSISATLAAVTIGGQNVISSSGMMSSNWAGQIGWGSGSRMNHDSNGRLWITTISGTPLGFEGVTSAFPALKRSTTVGQTTYLQARLADDSAFTSIQGKLTTDTAYTATTVVATGYITLYDSTGTAYRVPCAV